MRERRAAHVRPLPPPGERMKPRRPIRSNAPSPLSLQRYKPISTAPRMPVPIGLAIGSALLMLGLVVVLIGSGLVVNVAGGVGDAFHNAMTRLTSQAPETAAPSGAASVDSPTLDLPAGLGYTNVASQVLQGSVPPPTVGKSGYTVHVYQLGTGASHSKSLVASVNVGSTTKFATPPITLVEGPNVFAAALNGPSGEGDLSGSITITLDTAPPPITIASPRQNATINASTVTIAGQTDASINLIVRNQQISGGGVTPASSGPDGKFTASIPIIAGSNTIVVSGTDLAGNSASTTLTVKRAYGDLAAHLQVTPSRFAASAKTTLKLVMHATSVNGGPLAEGQVTFTVQVQGLAPVVSPQITTDATGTATWQIDISGATSGSGQASVLVTSPAGDTVTATAAITIT